MHRELEIIELIAQMSGEPAALADDAFWDVETREIVTTDMLVENRHFSQSYCSPQDIGWKAAAVNVSDIAAMGGQVKTLFISLGLPETIGLDWVRGFYEGVLAHCQQFGGRIAGGDTVGSSQLVVNVTAVGYCAPGHWPGHRFQAQPGDYILSSGPHGLSQVGLLALQADAPGFDRAKQAHRKPMPQVEAGTLLASRFERYALMDSSDGLADAILKIAQASRQKLVLSRENIAIPPEVLEYWHIMHPLAPESAVAEKCWESMLYGGEDFQLIATVPFLDEAILQRFEVIGRVEAPSSAELPGGWLRSDTTGEVYRLDLARTYHHFERAERP